jgi:hypothetical protein
VLRFDDSISLVTIEADHCQRVQAPRDLLELVEPNIPKSITGFPLRLRRVQTIRQLKEVDPQSEQRYKRLLAKAAKLASDGLEKALESGLDVVKIETSVPDLSVFKLSTDYSEVPDMDAFEKEFYVPHNAPDWD